MIFLADSSEDLEVIRKESGVEVGELFTPLTNFTPKDRNGVFGIDNGAFTRFNCEKFFNLLEKHEGRKENCLFVAIPDVVGSARRTLELFNHFDSFHSQKLCGWKKALVLQDGIENFNIPWGEIDAIFIGGSTEFKTSEAVIHSIRCAKIMDKWVHIGRINTPNRWRYFEELGADSCDGSGLSRFSDMRFKIKNEVESKSLFTEAL